MGGRARGVRRAVQGVGVQARRSARSGARTRRPAFARALRARHQELPAIPADGSRALRRRLPRLRARKARRGARAVRSHPAPLPRLALRAGRAHGQSRSAFQWQIRLRRSARRIRKSLVLPRQRSLRPRALQERVVHVAARSDRRRGEAVRWRVRGRRRRRGPEQGLRHAAEAARRAAERGAQVPRRGLHGGREEHRAGRLRLLAAIGSRARSCARSRCSSTIKRTTTRAWRRTSSS